MEIQAEEERYLEDYLQHIGWGTYYKLVIAVACACQFTTAFNFVTLIYTVALSSCDETFIPEIVALRMYTCYLIGSGIGGLLTNSLSDRYGRKRYLTYSLICLFFASFAAAFASNPIVMVGSTLMLGVGLETNTVQARLLLVEILTKEKRGFFVTFCDMFGPIGCTTIAFILFETATFFKFEKQPNLQLTTWRVMFAVSGGVSLVLACVCALIEESPRFYLYRERTYLAYLLLKQLFAINNSKFAEHFQVREDDLRNIIKSYELHYVEPEGFWDIFKKLCWRFWKSCQLMCSRRFCKTTWVLMILKILFVVIGLLQLNIIFAKQLVNTPTLIPQKYRALDFIYPVLTPFSYMSKEQANVSRTICQTNENNSLFYKYYCLLGSITILGQVLTMLIVDHLGRKFVMFAGLVLASCSCLTLGFIEHKWIQVLAACVIMACIGSVVSTTSLINLELYPTGIRGTSNTVTSAPGYLLAAFFINFAIIDHHIFTIILGIFYFCLSVFTCFLPESKGKPMVE